MNMIACRVCGARTHRQAAGGWTWTHLGDYCPGPRCKRLAIVHLIGGDDGAETGRWRPEGRITQDRFDDAHIR